jgi:hypothetical protein
MAIRYTHKEELWNSWSHAGGIAMGAVVGVIFLVMSFKGDNPWARLGVCLYLFGMLASYDPVALDQACVDLCQKATPVRNSQLGDNLAKPDWHHHHDHFTDSNPNVHWKEMLIHGEKIGLGTREYELHVVR